MYRKTLLQILPTCAFNLYSAGYGRPRDRSALKLCKTSQCRSITYGDLPELGCSNTWLTLIHLSTSIDRGGPSGVESFSGAEGEHIRARVNENHVSAVTVLEGGVAFDTSLPRLGTVNMLTRT